MPTKIEWTDESWNPIRARNRETGRAGHFCVHVSPACEHCYAEGMQARLFGNPVRYAAQDAEKVEIFLHEHALMQPLRWRRPRRIFVCSMTDLFYEGHSDDLIDQVFAAMALAPQHTFQVLTKRAERMHEYLTRPVQGPWAGRAHAVDDDGTVHDMTDVRFRMFKTGPDLFPKCPPGALNRASAWQDKHYPGGDGFVRQWPLPNVWLGVSVEDQRRANERIPILLDTPAAVRFLSAEPLLGPIDVPDGQWFGEDLIQWLIVGGESGPRARPTHPQWVRYLRDQCTFDGIAFFFKQWGEWLPGEDDFSKTGPPHYGMPDAIWQDGQHGHRFDFKAKVGSMVAWARDGSAHHLVTTHDQQEAFRKAHGRPAALALKIGKKRAGRLLDGREWNEMPA